MCCGRHVRVHSGPGLWPHFIDVSITVTCVCLQDGVHLYKDGENRCDDFVRRGGSTGFVLLAHDTDKIVDADADLVSLLFARRDKLRRAHGRSGHGLHRSLWWYTTAIGRWRHGPLRKLIHEVLNMLRSRFLEAQRKVLEDIFEHVTTVGCCDNAQGAGGRHAYGSAAFVIFV